MARVSLPCPAIGISLPVVFFLPPSCSFHFLNCCLRVSCVAILAPKLSIRKPYILIQVSPPSISTVCHLWTRANSRRRWKSGVTCIASTQRLPPLPNLPSQGVLHPSPFENQSRACIVGRSGMVPAAGRPWATGHARCRTGDIPELPCIVPVVAPVVTRTVCLLWAFSVSLTSPKVSRRPLTISRCWNIPAGIPLCTTNQRLCMSKALARVSDAAAAVPAAAPASLTALATNF